MYYIIYLSAGTTWFNEDQLKEILTVSNVNNTRDNITGLLLYGDGTFMQLLEGDENNVKAAFQKISLDKRHSGIATIASGPITERNFPQWAMGFKSVNSTMMEPYKGYFNPTNKSL